MENNEIARLRKLRLGKILCNTALFCGIVMLLFGLAPIISVLYYLIAFIIFVCILVVWLLSFLIIHPFEIEPFYNFLIGGGSSAYSYISDIAHKVAPYLGTAAIVFGALSIPLIIYSSRILPKGRITAASLAIGFAVIGLISVYAGGALI